MAGADLGGGGSRSHKKKGSSIKKPKRIGFSLDMTPLVDVAFLLLTFFMFATTMAQPQIMEMSTPPQLDVPIDVQASRLVTIYVRFDGKIFYNTGLDPAMQPLELNKIKEFSVQRNSEKGNDLITSLKVDPRAKYSQLIKVLDELNLAEGDLTEKYKQQKTTRERRFAMVQMTEQDKEELAKL
ncbi:MAG: biopolymer transporter ExbD [Bacteroidetes bacterium]|nr:biopolymer transporter ExbD [Bacteroidota bacterium]